ncbi:L,D-transpeptidase [Streptomyces olivoreticuli]
MTLRMLQCKPTAVLHVALLLCLGLPALTACGGSGKAAHQPDRTPQISISPTDGAKGVKPSAPISVQVDDGVLTGVRVTDPGGRQWPGTLKGSTFTPGHAFATGTTYQVTAAVKGSDGKRQEQRGNFTTLTPERVNTVEDLRPGKGSIIGVGQPVSLAFEHPVKDKAAVERRLKVTTSNNTEGSWGWVKEPLTGRDRVDWRPKEYWKPGTKVTLEADLNGVETSNGQYLTHSYSTSFAIGRSQIAKVDLQAHQLSLVRDGQTVKTLPVTGGDAGHTTWSGTMTLMSKDGTIRMDSRTVGLGTEYNQDVQRSMRLTVTGTYAHQAEWAESTIGTANTSHGCLGMKTADATWFYDQAQVGDVFEVSGGKETVAAGNGFGQWNLSWADWQEKSALRQAAR